MASKIMLGMPDGLTGSVLPLQPAPMARPRRASASLFLTDARSFEQICATLDGLEGFAKTEPREFFYRALDFSSSDARESRHWAHGHAASLHLYRVPGHELPATKEIVNGLLGDDQDGRFNQCSETAEGKGCVAAVLHGDTQMGGAVALMADKDVLYLELFRDGDDENPYDPKALVAHALGATGLRLEKWTVTELENAGDGDD